MNITDFKVGDMLAGTWGATMVIPAFYKVVRLTPKRLVLEEYDGRMINSDGFGQQGYEVPDYSRPKGQKMGRIEGGYVVVGSRYDTVLLKKWNGQPVWADYMD